MRGHRLARWLRSVLDTQDEELSCSECLDRVSAYVEAQLTGTGRTVQDAPLEQHLRQCRVCTEEYQILSELVQEEMGAGRME